LQTATVLYRSPPCHAMSTPVQVDPLRQEVADGWIDRAQKPDSPER
jgi:hypothetical protein